MEKSVQNGLSEQLQKNRRKRVVLNNVEGLAMAILPFIGYILFGLIPMLISLVVSFTDLRSYNISMATFAGFGNYIKLFQMPLVGKAVWNTLLYCLSVPINMIVSLFIAQLLTKSIKGKYGIRVVLYIPSVCSTVAISLAWCWIFEPNYGVINTVLTHLGLGKIPFMTDPRYFMPSVLIICLWQGGTNIVLMQSALASVSTELKEAALLDGATGRQLFFKIVFPLITPTLFYLLITNLLGALQNTAMMQIIAVNGVGPDYAALTLSYYIYRMAFVNTATEGLGLACALTWIMSIGVLLITFLNFKLSKKWVNYD